MRLFLSAATLASLMLAGAASAAETLTDDEILSDLVVVSAAPRSADVKMGVQTAKPSPEKEAKADASKQDAPQPIKTAAK